MEKSEKSEPNRNSEYDERLIFVRIVIPAGERLMRKAQTKKRWNEMETMGCSLLLLLFLSLRHVAHTHPNRPEAHWLSIYLCVCIIVYRLGLGCLNKRKIENYLFCSIEFLLFFSLYSPFDFILLWINMCTTICWGRLVFAAIENSSQLLPLLPPTQRLLLQWRATSFTSLSFAGFLATGVRSRQTIWDKLICIQLYVRRPRVTCLSLSLHPFISVIIFAFYRSRRLRATHQPFSKFQSFTTNFILFSSGYSWSCQVFETQCEPSTDPLHPQSKLIRYHRNQFRSIRNRIPHSFTKIESNQRPGKIRRNVFSVIGQLTRISFEWKHSVNNFDGPAILCWM